MSQTTPAPLCTTILPNGRRCGSFALHGKRICYHHSADRPTPARDARLAKRLDSLNQQFARMSAADLLLHLHRQLSTLPRTLSRFPEVGFALACALNRLEEITALESKTPRHPQQNQKVARSSGRTLAKSVTYANAPAESGIYAQSFRSSPSNQQHTDPASRINNLAPKPNTTNSIKSII